MPDLTTAARELLRLKDLHDLIELRDFATWQGYADACDDYQTNKPKAWAALRAALGSSVSGWQDIETAPESCRGEYPRYILFYNGCHVGVGFCYPSEDGDNGTLYVDESDAIITPEPTHWQPLPAPPAHQPDEVKNG